MEKKMGKQKNIMKQVIYNLKENIKMEKSGMVKAIIISIYTKLKMEKDYL